MGVGCKRVNYQFSPPTSRALPLDTEFYNYFIVLPKGVKEVLFTNQPTNQPYSTFLIESITFPLVPATSATPEPLHVHTHREVTPLYSSVMKAVRYLDSER